eukprot:s1060_g5.t1
MVQTISFNGGESLWFQHILILQVSHSASGTLHYSQRGSCCKPVAQRRIGDSREKEPEKIAHSQHSKMKKTATYRRSIIHSCQVVSQFQSDGFHVWSTSPDYIDYQQHFGGACRPKATKTDGAQLQLLVEVQWDNPTVTFTTVRLAPPPLCFAKILQMQSVCASEFNVCQRLLKGSNE